MQEKLKKQLERHEGVKLMPYRCTAGKLTIGCGRNIEDRGISQDESDLMLANDIKSCTYKVSTGLPWTKSLDYARFAVLVNMCFNLGFRGLMNFKKMLKACEEHEYRTAAAEMLNSRWSKQVGSRATELAEQMVTGEWR